MKENRINPSESDILIVDDKPDNIRILSSLLKEQGYKVRQALSGEMALMAARAAQPDLILLDIMMPGLDGYQVCELLKKDATTATIPVIFLSALDDIIDKVTAFKSGGIDYITKPFHVEEVLLRVENHLSLKAAERKIMLLNAQLEQRVTERTRQLEIANAKLLEMALHDPLTGLPNRALFMERIQAEIARSHQNREYQFVVMFLDCDRFKVINDSLGHIVGDQLLVAIARRLQEHLDPKDTLARLGGDEFAILLPDVENIHFATRVAQNMIDALCYPFKLERHEVFINASIGIAPSRPDYYKPEHLLRDADTAMYRAKNSGRACYHIFDPAMHDAAVALLELENDLRRAVEREEFILHYQPIVDLALGKITGCEALIRWRHPERGMVSPASFIPVAEETGLIVPIGNWVMRQACHQLRLWQEQKLAPVDFSMGVNLSVRQFSQPNLIGEIDRVLQENYLTPQHLKLEITETAIMDNPRKAAQILLELRAREIQLAIDDFGTGYSSLSYLHSFPVDMLKVDRSFVNGLPGNKENFGLVVAIINIARTMGMTVVAEGIETDEQLGHLRDLNCRFGQGYLFSKPVDAHTAGELIAANPRW
ncbi:MAG TPA: EAL domain-containing protein [Oscillatoriaceae cyanobacterium M33_DOE_052]|uniref:GGDEF domain-containing response regulator n=1 Tax=Planktothricoides sp. SpSt-374 TaxID=2282167 RepID=A0A7C3VF59_9CYAN|nr:EAL domain-containing protein [Oscillatoriaceae cyanobacterium M33_DOE_052]